MKLIYLAIVSLQLISSVVAQSNDQNKIIITGSRFTYPLLEKWIEEFQKENPDVKFRLIPRGTPNVDSANFIINAHELSQEEIRVGYKVVNINRYAILPVANEKNPHVKEYFEQGIKEKELKKLFFHKHDPFANVDKDKEAKRKEKHLKGLVLYTRQQKACAPTTFAKNYGFLQEDILGTPIGGDDKHLIQAVIKDTNGLTYNNLGLIYDLKTRTINPKLRVVPIDLNNNGKLDDSEKFYNTLDEVITRLETKQVSQISIGYVNISFPQDSEKNRTITLFLNWILANGNKYK